MGLDELGLDVVDELTRLPCAFAERVESGSDGGLELWSVPVIS